SMKPEAIRRQAIRLGSYTKHKKHQLGHKTSSVIWHSIFAPSLGRLIRQQASAESCCLQEKLSMIVLRVLSWILTGENIYGAVADSGGFSRRVAESSDCSIEFAANPYGFC